MALWSGETEAGGDRIKALKSHSGVGQRECAPVGCGRVGRYPFEASERYVKHRKKSSISHGGFPSYQTPGMDGRG